MTQTCNNSPACVVTCVGVGIIWWLVSSGLLFLAWNRVIGHLFKVKSVKFDQAALVIATLVVTCLVPKMYLGKMQRGWAEGKCHKKSCCHEAKHAEGNEEGEKGDCPYSRKAQHDKNEKSAEE